MGTVKEPERKSQWLSVQLIWNIKNPGSSLCSEFLSPACPLNTPLQSLKGEMDKMELWPPAGHSCLGGMLTAV